MRRMLLLLVLIAGSVVSFAFTVPPSGSPSPKILSKSLVFPVAGGKSFIRDKWGASRAGGLRKHKGIDIHARKGTPVVAICDGLIVNRDHTPIGGKTLWLKSPQQTWTAYYAHLDQQLVKEGQFVRKGQVIGTIGNTGNARTTPSHLHFGISEGKNWVNPLPYIKYAQKVKVHQRVQRKPSIHSKKYSSKRSRR